MLKGKKRKLETKLLVKNKERNVDSILTGEEEEEERKVEII